MKTIKNNLAVLKYVYRFCPIMIIFAFFYIVASIILAVSKIFIIAEAIDLVMGSANLDLLFTALFRYLFIIIITSLFRIFYTNYISPRYRTVYIKKMQQFLFSKVKDIDMESFDNPEFYDNYSRALREGSVRGIQVFSELVRFLSAITVSLAIGTIIIISDLKLLFIIIISSIINFIFVVTIDKRWYLWSKETEQDRRMYYYVNRTFYRQRFAGEIKTTPVSKLLINKYREATKTINQKYAQTHRGLMKYNIIYHFFGAFIEHGLSILYLGQKLFSGKLMPNVFVASINAILQFSHNFNDAIYFLRRIKEHSLYIDDFLWLINYQPQVEKREGKRIHSIDELKIENLSFMYPEADNFALEKININLQKGEKIALVGHNGSGKTTLIKLLLRFYLPQEGKIYLNKQDYRTLDVQALRDNYAVIFQDFQIYAMTIGENILMREVKDKEDEKKIWRALEMVGMKEKIASLPDGINTEVTREFSRRGAVFSGGEIQRLAIARVFASDASLYILDEPTSSLDPLSEEKINKLIIKNADKTMIIIAHRLSTVVDVDKIYLIDRGRIVEEGSHQQLLQKNGLYAKMFLTQKNLYIKN